MSIEFSSSQLSGDETCDAAGSGDTRARRLDEIRRDPANADAWHLLGLAEVRAGRLNSAQRALSRAVKLSPGVSRYHCSLGKLLERQQNDDAALAEHTRALECDALQTEAWSCRGRLNLRLERLEQAEFDLRTAARQAPDSAPVLNALGEVLVLRGDRQQAGRCFERAIRASPGYAAAYDNLGALYLDEGRTRQATRCFEHALRNDADLASAHENLARALLEDACLEAALSHADQALNRAPGRASCHALRGRLMLGLGRLSDAERSLRDSLQLDPDQPEALSAMALLMDRHGDTVGGLELIESAAAAPDAPGGLVAACARLLNNVYRVPEARALIADHAERTASFDNPVRRALHFVAGDMDEREGRYGQAARHYRLGNRMRDAAFDEHAFRAFADQMVSTFGKAAYGRLPRARDRGDRMVVLVGPPRCGGSLLEQALARHPSVRSLADPRACHRAFGRIPAGAMEGLAFPQGLSPITREGVETLGAAFRASHAPWPAGGLRIVERSAFSFLYLGLMALIFPGASVVYVRRNPLDNLISCYATDDYPCPPVFGTTLRAIAVVQEVCERMMVHWGEVCALPSMNVRYEQMVNEPEASVRAVLDFLGLTWDDHCLDFYAPFATLRGASCAPRSIYNTSIDRHRRFETLLAPTGVSASRD